MLNVMSKCPSHHPFFGKVDYSATNSTGTTQHKSANHRSPLQQRSLALVVCKPIKNENISLNSKVSVFSGGLG